MENLLPKFPRILTRSCRGSLGYIIYIFFYAFLLFTGPACTSLSGASALSTPLALSRPWGIPHAKGYGVVGVRYKPRPWGVESCPGGHPLSIFSCPEPFGPLKSSAPVGKQLRRTRGGRRWPLCQEPLMMGSRVQDETLEQEGSAGSFPF